MWLRACYNLLLSRYFCVSYVFIIRFCYRFSSIIKKAMKLFHSFFPVFMLLSQRCKHLTYRPSMLSAACRTTPDTIVFAEAGTLLRCSFAQVSAGLRCVPRSPPHMACFGDTNHRYVDWTNSSTSDNLLLSIRIIAFYSFMYSR